MHFIYFSLLTCFSVSLSYFPVSPFCFLLFSYLPVFLSFSLSLSLLLSLSLFLVLLSNSFSVSLSPSFPKLIYLDRLLCTVLSKPLGMAHSVLQSVQYSIFFHNKIYLQSRQSEREKKVQTKTKFLEEPILLRVSFQQDTSC